MSDLDVLDSKAPPGPRSRSEELHVRILTWSELAPLQPAFSQLASNALEPNPYFHPSFALSAAQHLDSAGQVVFIVAFSAYDDHRMEGLLPVCRSSSGGLARVWRHRLAPLAAPLIRSERAPETLDAMMREALRVCGAAALELPCCPMDGDFARVVRALEATWRITPLARLDRPVLASRTCGDSRTLDDPAGSLRALVEMDQKLRRPIRRLSGTSAWEHVCSTSVVDAALAMERFLAMEAAGWKGRRGTALLSDAAEATFARTMARRCSGEGKLAIDALMIAGAPIAMAVSLSETGRTFLWKSAYDERYASFSPGALLIGALSHRIASTNAEYFCDSCAAPDNPMIYRLWPDRRAIGDWIFAPLDEGRPTTHALQRERLRRGLLAAGKKAFRAARGWDS